MSLLKIKKINGKLNIIGKNLRKYRELRGLTQRQLKSHQLLQQVELMPTEIQSVQHNVTTTTHGRLRH